MGFTAFPPRLIAQVQGVCFTYQVNDSFNTAMGAEPERREACFKSINTVVPMSFAGWGDRDESGAEK